MIPPPVLRPCTNVSVCCRKEPLPAQFPWGGRIFLFEQTSIKTPAYPAALSWSWSFFAPSSCAINSAEIVCGIGTVRSCLALSMKREDSGVEIEILQPQFQAFEETKAAAIQQLDPKS